MHSRLAGASFPGRTLPPPDPERLERAGRLGLRDPELRQEAHRLVPLVLEGLQGLGPGVAGPGVIQRVQDFFESCTLPGRDPGDHAGEWVTD